MKGELTFAGTTWEVLPSAPGVVNDLSVGVDGTIVVATDRGIYSYEAGAWQPIDNVSRNFSAAVSAGDAQHIFAVVGSIPFHYYKTQTGGWASQPLVGEAQDISGASDGTVYAIADPGTVYVYTSMTSYVETYLPLDRISVGGKGLIYGTLNEQKSAFHVVGAEPILIGNNLKQISVGADGTVWGVDGLGGVYRMVASADGTRWELIKDAPSLEQISVGSRYQVIGIAGSKIYRYQPEGYTPAPVKSFTENDYGDLNMCASLAQMAYGVQPLEAAWSGSIGKSVVKQLAGSLWTAQNFYYDYSSSTQAFLAYSTPSNNRKITLSFRGSQELGDLVLDITEYPYLDMLDSSIAVSALVHRGWQQIRGQVIADLKAVLEKIGGASQLKGLYVTGHSLGAALATYATYDLLVSKAVPEIDPKKFHMINFASPPVGNKAFAAAYNALGITSYRVLDPKDPIILAGSELINLYGWADVANLVALPPGAGHPILNYINLINRLYLKSNEVSIQTLLKPAKKPED
jgi:hypothetical protein